MYKLDEKEFLKEVMGNLNAFLCYENFRDSKNKRDYYLEKLKSNFQIYMEASINEFKD